jgi:S-adenosylmethionine:tRNA ribosyltransferase-isomerase
MAYADNPEMDKSPDLVRIADYTYTLPEEMIARYPLENRAHSKLLVYDRGKISHTTFSNISGLARETLMIFNNTRVIQARILMYKDTGPRIELLLLEPLSPSEYNLAFSTSSGCLWKCMTGNKKRWKGGELTKEIIIDREKIILSARILKDHGPWQETAFSWVPSHQPFGSVIEAAGITPIPPYLGRMPEEDDRSRYQTVYSRHEGSVAAPTAGLHFTDEILGDLKKYGTLTGEITLHVGAGTFLPVKSPTAGGHPMHAEHFSAGRKIIEQIRNNPGRVTAVGTTSARALESLYWLGVKQLLNGNEQQGSGGTRRTPLLLSQWEHLHLPADLPPGKALDALLRLLAQEGVNSLEAKTEIMITPGYNFRIADRLVTNFHQPESTLLMLIAAFIGDDWRRVYNYALNNNFRFLSYGDSSLLIR